MRVLLVSPLPPPEGGIATWTEQYIDYCEKKRIDIDASIVNIAVNGSRLKKINSKRKFTDEIIRTKNIIRDLNYKINTFAPQIVHINSSCAKLGLIRDCMCILIAKQKKCKVILHCRCTVQDRLGDRFVSKKIFQIAAKNSDLVLTLNKQSEKYIKNIMRCNKVKTIPNFITMCENDEIFDVKPLVENVLFVGHVQFDKGIREIYEVARCYPKMKFFLAGPVSNEVDMVQKPQNVNLLGVVSHSRVKELIQKADLFLFPSYTEGFSNSLVEAMAYGSPIIATDVGANFDMIENIGGIIVPPRNFESIKSAIDKMSDAQLRKEMSIWNRNKAYNNYSIDIVMKELFGIYKGLLQ